MLKTFFGLALMAALGLGSVAWAQTQPADPKASALSWQKQANDTRAVVAGVAEELEKIGDQGNVPAKGMIDDAKRWLAEGDKTKALADEKLGRADYQKASYDYNMTWQHYVRAATSGLNAKRMLTGEYTRRSARALRRRGWLRQTSAASPSVERCSLERRVELEGIE
jgi:hypothetical protein